MSTSKSLPTAILTIYIIISPLFVYIGIRHGQRAWAPLGWGFLFLFCSLKIIGSGLQLGDPTNTGASIISSIGLSPLLLGLAGVLHEA